MKVHWIFGALLAIAIVAPAFGRCAGFGAYFGCTAAASHRNPWTDARARLGLRDIGSQWPPLPLGPGTLASPHEGAYWNHPHYDHGHQQGWQHPRGDTGTTRTTRRAATAHDQDHHDHVGGLTRPLCTTHQQPTGRFPLCNFVSFVVKICG